MSDARWVDVVERPDGLDDETVSEFCDQADEGCPSPPVGAREAIRGLASGDLPVQATDHVPNVPLRSER